MKFNHEGSEIHVGVDNPDSGSGFYAVIERLLDDNETKSIFLEHHETRQGAIEALKKVVGKDFPDQLPRVIQEFSV